MSHTNRTRAAHTLGRTAGYFVDVRLTTDAHADDLADLDKFATLVMQQGSFYLQTYATADQCRAIARSLLEAAADLDTIAAIAIPEAA